MSFWMLALTVVVLFLAALVVARRAYRAGRRASQRTMMGIIASMLGPQAAAALVDILNQESEGAGCGAFIQCKYCGEFDHTLQPDADLADSWAQLWVERHEMACTGPAGDDDTD